MRFRFDMNGLAWTFRERLLHFGSFLLQVLHSFKWIFIVFILITNMSVLICAANLALPGINDWMVVSPGTPWGIVTSVFAHRDVGHVVGNILSLFVCWLLFVVSNLNSSDNERKRRASFLLVATFLGAVGANLVWLFSVPCTSSLGASGLVYASFGVLFGLSLSNCLGVHILSEMGKSVGAFLSWSFNLMISVWSLLWIVRSPASFLGVWPGVNSFVHGVAFLGGIVVATLWVGMRRLQDTHLKR